jgi:deazaflavin-dependent oxidoreductase (nitroreductase family)
LGHPSGPAGRLVRQCVSTAYLNLVANPIVTVEVGGETYQARAHSAQTSERERLYAQHADLHQSFNDYVKKTSRVIPVVVLERIPE